MFELQHAVLLGGGALAGFINSLAGGGSALTIPIMMSCGLDARVANGTNRLAVFAQSVSAVGTFHQGGTRPWKLLVHAAPPTLLGAGVGVSVATSTSPELTQIVFGIVFGILAIVTIAKPSWLTPEGITGGHKPSWAGRAGLTAVGFYGGFFQAGVGVPLLIVCARSMGVDLVAGNALKVALILIYTAFALGAFAWAGQVAYFEGGLLAIGGLLGSYIGARAAIKKGALLVRIALFMALIASAVSMFVR